MKVRKILKLVSAILMTASTVMLASLLVPLAWMIPMTIRSWKIFKEDETPSVERAVCTYYFASGIAGIIYLVDYMINNKGKRLMAGAYAASLLATLQAIPFLFPLFYRVAFTRTIKEAYEYNKKISVVTKVFTIIFNSLIAGVLLFVADAINKEEKELQRFGIYSERKEIELLKLSKIARFGYNVVMFFAKFPRGFVAFFKKVGLGIVGFFKKVGLFFKDLVLTFIRGSWKTKISYFIMGFGSFARGQWLRGLLFLAFQAIFITYMIMFGGGYLAKLGSLGTIESQTLPDGSVIAGDNSFNIMLYGVLTLFFVAAFLVTWYFNVKQNRINDQIEKDKKKIQKTGDDLRAMVDKNFHTTLLALPTLGITIFTVLPIFFMILVAFTNYDSTHDPFNGNLFGWVLFDNFGKLLTWTNGAGGEFAMTFGQILLWTLVWAFFATFTNYFIGMLIAMLINKKGIKLKKLWRTILVFSIAVPQFISLLFVSQMFSDSGIINGLYEWFMGLFGVTVSPIPFWTNPWLARITVIVINIWIGVPYLMLVVTGILMNIPADLYESANIDGAKPWQQYTKITLPYMLFITGPYLLTSFTGNMNNFNVIYLLTGGRPLTQALSDGEGHIAGQTDLLITWLFSLASTDSNYKLAAVIGIMVFIVVSVLSLVVYNLIPSTRNEEEFQ